jgi:hypothetical protein
VYHFKLHGHFGWISMDMLYKISCVVTVKGVDCGGVLSYNTW